MAAATSEVINVHFDENRKRQGLTSGSSGTDPKGEEAEAVDDKSRKGSIDTRIINLVHQINNISPSCPHQDISVTSPSSSKVTSDESPTSKTTELWNYFTTSSCSGRAILFTHDESRALDEDVSIGGDVLPQLRKANQKKGCKWLYVTHDEINPQEIMTCWRALPAGTYAVFKVEPSIFHIQCRTLTSARELIQIAATQSGFRNSGMVIGKEGKITVAVRSTIGLEVPLPVGSKEDGNSIVSDKFLEYLIDTGNETLRQNWTRTEKFANEFQKHFFPNDN